MNNLGLAKSANIQADKGPPKQMWLFINAELKSTVMEGKLNKFTKWETNVIGYLAGLA